MRICWTSQCHRSVHLLFPNAGVHKLSKTFSCKKCIPKKRHKHGYHIFINLWLRINKTENETTPTRKLSRGKTRKSYAVYWGGQWKFQQYFDMNWLSRLASASNCVKREISSYFTCIIEWYPCIQWGAHTCFLRWAKQLTQHNGGQVCCCFTTLKGLG
jgi:hypothetical protein